jgi:hypothetical protein
MTTLENIIAVIVLAIIAGSLVIPGVAAFLIHLI